MLSPKDFTYQNNAVKYSYNYEEIRGLEQKEYQSKLNQSTPEPDDFQQPTTEVVTTSVARTELIPNTSIETSIVIDPLMAVLVIKPDNVEEMPKVIQLLQQGKSVLLNLTNMEPEQAQRAVDFVAGGTYAIDGYQQRVGEMIFLFTPVCVQITTFN